ncbi:MAG TPA: LON peptidase substrate-binding domain-containing protein [Gemmatimonadales bacterium]|nr:LON peptidase substrate-binding domain-containing protein [Gemmatimonadales bacterium]
MPYRLPVFPLELVLFPGALVPLHIFEPRYRRMLADCLAGDRRFGITPITPDGEAPPAGAVGCVALIRAAQALPDGRSNIAVSGETRFVVRAYQDEPLPYRVALVEDVEDADREAPPDRTAELRALASRYAEALNLLNDADPTETAWSDDPQALSFQAAAAAELSVPIKQQLLDLRSTRERVEQLLRLLPPLVVDALERARVHVRARSNGTGGSRPEITAIS